MIMPDSCLPLDHPSFVHLHSTSPQIAPLPSIGAQRTHGSSSQPPSEDANSAYVRLLPPSPLAMSETHLMWHLLHTDVTHDPTTTSSTHTTPHDSRASPLPSLPSEPQCCNHHDSLRQPSMRKVTYGAAAMHGDNTELTLVREWIRDESEAF